jgi:hypothetical protein
VPRCAGAAVSRVVVLRCAVVISRLSVGLRVSSCFGAPSSYLGCLSASACLQFGVESPQCKQVMASWSDPAWRAAQPGAMQNPCWEENSLGEGCVNLQQPCLQVR